MSPTHISIAEPSNSESFKLHFIKLPSKKSESSLLLTTIKSVEKHTFPSNELFDFDSELLKRTTNLYCACVKTSDGASNLQLCGYIVYLRSKILTRIHKVCVVEPLRGRGIGRYMVNKVVEELRKGGVSQVDLWVDEARAPARALYRGCGFDEKEVVSDYYGKGRTGIRMSLDLFSGII